ncbi:hypothetical protein, partial [Escherichia coli]|uniref:hypothetical protein n=1 Tax=Escherichia coli TaxID=562 RepID=UPI001954B459
GTSVPEDWAAIRLPTVSWVGAGAAVCSSFGVLAAAVCGAGAGADGAGAAGAADAATCALGSAVGIIGAATEPVSPFTAAGPLKKAFLS